MSDLKTITLKFKKDFADWEWLLREDGETEEGIEEIRQAIRDDWHDEELRNLWIASVAERAAFRNELIELGKQAMERIKNVANAN